MMETRHTSVPGVIMGSVLLFFCQQALAGEYSDIIDEEYLRSQFTYAAGDKLKYSQCKKKTYPTCTYIWGAESKQDAARTKYGLTPGGNKLQVIYAPAKSKKDFERVLATYKDAEKIDGLAAEAAWSNKRKQLSMITDKNLIIHINVEDKGPSDAREKATIIAHDILKKL